MINQLLSGMWLGVGMDEGIRLNVLHRDSDDAPLFSDKVDTCSGDVADGF